MTAISDLSAQREAMVEQQIRRRGIDDPTLIAAFRAVPREMFIADELLERAYSDAALPIDCGQTISQPYIVALTLDAACIGPGDRLLEIGAGSGYAAAVASRVAAEVIAIERHGALARLAADRIAGLHYTNVRIVEGDGTAGRPDEAPFDAIVVAAAATHIPKAWIDQLKVGGRLVMPLEEGGGQVLVRLVKQRDGSIERTDLCSVRFVPLIAPSDC